MCQQYQQDGSPIGVLSTFLSVVTKGAASTPLGNFDDKEFDDRRAYVSPVKGGRPTPSPRPL
jgi:hypothetical protein